MFGIGMPEFLLIMAIALIVIGPKKLPDLAKALGKALGEFKKATSDLKDSMEIEKPLSDVKRTFDDLNRDITKNASQQTTDQQNLLQEGNTKVEIPPEPYLEKVIPTSGDSEKIGGKSSDLRENQKSPLKEDQKTDHPGKA